MPGLNGIESLRALRNENELIPCIILTGDAYLIDRSEAQDLGVVAILEKPAKFDELEAALLKACLELNACTEATLAFPNSEPEVV
jgi:DNA-binding response OmpR family regulator